MTDSATGGQHPRTSKAQQVFDMIKNKQVDVAKVESFLKSGLFVDSKDKDGFTLLVKAVDLGNLELVQLLCRYMADTNIGAPYGRTKNSTPPLELAYNEDRLDIMEALLSAPKKANPDADCGDGQVLLHKTAGQNSVSRTAKPAAELLLRYNATVDMRPERTLANRFQKRETPLMVAISSRDMEMIQLFLEHKANPNLTEHEGAGKTAFALAVEQKSTGTYDLEKAIALFIKHGGDPDILNGRLAERSGSPMHIIYKDSRRSGYESRHFLQLLDYGAQLSEGWANQGYSGREWDRVNAPIQRWHEFQQRPDKHLDKETLIYCANIGKLNDALTYKPWSAPQAKALLDAVNELPPFLQNRLLIEIDMLSQLSGDLVGNIVHHGRLGEPSVAQSKP